MLNVVDAWRVTKLEAMALMYERSTAGGWRVSSAARSWLPTSPASSDAIRTPRPKVTFGLSHDAAIRSLAPTPQVATIFTSAQGAVMAQMRHQFLLQR